MLSALEHPPPPPPGCAIPLHFPLMHPEQKQHMLLEDLPPPNQHASIWYRIRHWPLPVNHKRRVTAGADCQVACRSSHGHLECGMRHL